MASPWRFRVLRHDGSELTSDLEHPAGGSIERYGLKRGQVAPQATLGRWNLPLYPPQLTEKRKRAVGVKYAELLKGMRIERYDRSKGGLADPEATGVIDQVTPTLTGLTLEGTDWLAVIDRAHTERDQGFKDTATNLISYALEDWTLAYGDDFSLGENGSRVTGFQSLGEELVIQDPAFLSGGAATPYEQTDSTYADPPDPKWLSSLWRWSRPCAAFVAPPSPGANSYENAILHTGAYTVDQTPPVKFDATFQLRIPKLDVAAPEGTEISATAGIVIAYSGYAWLAAEVTLTVAQARETKLNLALQRFSSNGNVATYPAPISIPLRGASPDLLGFTTEIVQMSLLINEIGAIMTVRGQDLDGAAAVFDTTDLNDHGGSPISSVGIRGSIWQEAAAGNVDPVKVLCRDLMVWKRRPVFKLAPNFPVTTDTLEHTFNKTSQLEMLMIAANDADLDLRKVCKPDMDWIEAGPFLPGSVDLAVGKTATASADAGAGFTPDKAVDGDEATYWSGSVGVAGNWLQVDLGAATEVGALRLNSYWTPDQVAHGVLVYTIKSSPNGTTWTDRATVFPAHGDQITYFDTNITARYWRVELGAGGVVGRPNVITLGVYGPVPVFKDGPVGNVADGGLQDASSEFATVLRVTGGGAEGDPLAWESRDLAAIRKYGRIVREEGLQDAVPYPSIMRAGDALGALSSAPLTAGDLTVKDGPGVLKENRMVRVQLSKVPGMADVVKEVLGFTETEGQEKKPVHLDQYPNTMSRLAIQRQVSLLDKAMSGSLGRDNLPPRVDLMQDHRTTWPASAGESSEVALTAPFRSVVWGAQGDWATSDGADWFLYSYQPTLGYWVQIDIHVSSADVASQFTHTTWLIKYPWTPDPHTRLRLNYEGMHLGGDIDMTVFMTALA